MSPLGGRLERFLHRQWATLIEPEVRMIRKRRRSWTDDRDGREWEILYEPPVELDNRRVRRFRERLVLRSGEETLVAPAIYGSDLDTLTEADLRGLLDEARSEADDDGPWQGEGPGS